MIESGRAAARAVDVCAQRVAEHDPSADEPADVHMRNAALLSVCDDKAHVCAAQFARVPHLATRLGVERRAVEYHFAFLARIQHLYWRAIFEYGDDLSLAIESFVALKKSACSDRRTLLQFGAEPARGPGALALRLHQ